MASLFPIIGSLKQGDEKVSPKARVLAVNGITAYERVYKGPALKLDDSVSASVAVILWSGGKDGRPLVAEFSFRYRDKKEDFSAETAQSARQFFESLKTLDWCRDAGATKTQYVYRR